MFNTAKMFHTNMQHVMSNNLVSCITIFLLHVKPHGVRGLSKKYHLDLDPKLDNGKFAIQRIPFEFVASTNMLGMACVPGVDYTKQPRYQPVVDCKYWLVLGYFNNYNIIHFTNKLHAVRTLMRCIRLCYMASVPIWHHYHRLVNMVLSIH